MTVLQDIVAANRAGERRGIGSVCSAHPLVLEAAIDAARIDGRPLLIEATCNQVNQEGGYTGMRAEDFRALVTGLARERGLPAERLILGGDHLGPNPWRNEPAEELRGLAKSRPPASAWRLLSASNAASGMYTSPRTSITSGTFFPLSFFGRSFSVRTFSVTSSPTRPSPRVAAWTYTPFS